MTEAGKTIEENGVSIIGPINLAATIPIDASLMYSKNVINLFRHLYPKSDPDKPGQVVTPDFDDEITKGACITRDGEIVNEAIKNALQQGVKEQ